MLIFIKKETVSSIIFRSGYSRHEWNFIFFVVHGSTILIDGEQWHKIYSDEVLHCLTWICVIPTCCFFFDECLNKETPDSIFWQKKENKSIVSVFSSTYSLVTASWCSVGLARVTIFYCSYLYHFLELIHQDCLRLLRNSFFFYFQINEFLQEATQFQVEQSEALLWRNHALVHLSDSRVQAHLNSQVIFRYWRPHGRPHGICGSPLATFQLTSDIKISHILWAVETLFLQANRS